MPFKIITVALHEFGHASAGCCTGAKVISIEVNPDEGIINIYLSISLINVFIKVV